MKLHVFPATTNISFFRLMQGWLFVNDPSFWQPAQAEALLTSVPQVSKQFYGHGMELAQTVLNIQKMKL
jgi:hypothetical protein